MFMDWKTWHGNDVISFQIDLDLMQCLKTPTEAFWRHSKFLLKFIWKGAGPRMAKTLGNKKHSGRNHSNGY